MSVVEEQKAFEIILLLKVTLSLSLGSALSDATYHSAELERAEPNVGVILDRQCHRLA